MNNEILTKAEKEYLEEKMKPFKKYVINISKQEGLLGTVSKLERIKFYCNYKYSTQPIYLLWFSAGESFKGMEKDKPYTLRELGLND